MTKLYEAFIGNCRGLTVSELKVATVVELRGLNLITTSLFLIIHVMFLIQWNDNNVFSIMLSSGRFLYAP